MVIVTLFFLSKYLDLYKKNINKQKDTLKTNQSLYKRMRNSRVSYITLQENHQIETNF